MSNLLILNAIELGLVFSLISLGVCITLKIIDFPDMTVNGSFVLGAAVSTMCLINGVQPYVALGFATLSGAIAGIATALLNIKAHVPNLLSSVISMMGLYSINLRIMGRPNISLYAVDTIFSIISVNRTYIIAIIVLSIVAVLIFFFHSEIGLGIRASGQNHVFGSYYGIPRGFTITVALAVSNALVALSGSIFSQLQGFVDVNMGNGILIIGLASVIIGEKIQRSRAISSMFLCCVVGAIAYELIVSLALESSSIGIRPSDIYLANAVLIVIFMMGRRKTIFKEQ